MKKFVSFVVGLVCLLGFALPASAANGVSASEQKILDALNQGATIGGKQYYLDAAEINSAENYLKSFDLTDAQVNEAVRNIQAARSLVGSASVNTANAATLRDALKLLPASTITQLQNYIIAAGNAVGVKITFGSNGSYSATAISVTDSKGKVVYQNGNPIKSTGASYLLSGIALAGLLITAAGAAIVLSKKEQQFA